jgi:hypothetical protein
MSPNLEPQGSSYLESEREVGGGAGVGVGMRDKWLGKVRLMFSSYQKSQQLFLIKNIFFQNDLSFCRGVVIRFIVFNPQQ